MSLGEIIDAPAVTYDSLGYPAFSPALSTKEISCPDFTKEATTFGTKETRLSVLDFSSGTDIFKRF